MKKIGIILTIMVLVLGGAFLLFAQRKSARDKEAVMEEGQTQTEDTLGHEPKGHGDPSHEEHEEMEEVDVSGVSQQLLSEMNLTGEELREKCQEYALSFAYTGTAAFEKKEEDPENPYKTYYQFTLIDGDEEHSFTLIKEVLDGGEEYWKVKDGTYGSWGDEED